MASTKSLGPMGIGLMIILMAQPLGYDLGSGFIVWNVGQGQWATSYSNLTCDHFDSGGDRRPNDRVETICQNKINRFWLSHWDLDHIGFFPRLRRKLKNWCLEGLPNSSGTSRKMAIVKGVATCFASSEISKWIYEPSDRKSSNGASRVAQSGNWLIPGDSPRQAETLWSKHLIPGDIRRLLLGHHGSRTSTGSALLDRLSHLNMAVASARLARYKHPHPETRTALKGRGISLIQTEIWGSLRFPN